MPKLVQTIAPSIPFPGRRFISPVCSGFIVADGVSRSKERSVTENIAKEAPAAINKQITGRGKSAKLHPKLLHSAVKCDEYASCKNTPSSFLCLFPTVVVQPLCLSFFFFYPPSLISRPFMLPPHFWPLPISLVMPQCFLPINIVASFWVKFDDTKSIIKNPARQMASLGMQYHNHALLHQLGINHGFYNPSLLGLMYIEVWQNVFFLLLWLLLRKDDLNPIPFRFILFPDTSCHCCRG